MKSRNFLVIIVIVLLLSACASKIEVITPEMQTKMDSDIKQGNYVLDCGFKCSYTWINQVKAIHALDMAESWKDLYTKVMAIGYKEDLGYYYLGQAAQGLGYHQAAIKYYKYAAALASGQDGTVQCASGANDFSDPCQGVDIVAVTPELIKYSQNVLTPAPVAAPPASTSSKKKHAKKSTASSTWTAPPPQ